MYRARVPEPGCRRQTGSILNDLGTIHAGGRYRMKDLEMARIFEAIVQEPGTTRTQIGKGLSIRPTSISHAVGELAVNGLIREVREPGENRQGRPEIRLYPEKDRFVVISVYVASRTLRAAVVNAFEDVLASVEVLIEAEITNRQFLAKFETAVNSLKSRISRNSELLGISLSVPGFMDTDKEMWIFTARWPSLRKLSFKAIEKTVGAPLALSRVLDAVLEYIIARDDELKSSDTLLVHWGYGIGAAYANAGKVLSSNIGGVCEVGHWKVRNADAETCACGSTGCLETVSSLRVLAPRLRADYPDLPEDEQLFVEYVKRHDSITAHPAVREAAEEMGRAVGTLFITLFPKTVLVYGAMCNLPSVRKIFLESVRANIPEFARTFLNIRFLAKGHQSEIFGSARPLFREAYKRFCTRGEGENRLDSRPLTAIYVDETP